MNPTQINPWYNQRGQWSWIAGGVVLTVSSIFLLNETMAGRSLGAHLSAARCDLAASHAQNEDVRATVQTYDELIRKYDAQRDELIREIGDFQREIEVLSARTKRLELVGEKLTQLDHEFQRFQTEKEGFQKSLGRLEGAGVK